MGEESKISWTDATFNPWRGCTKVAEECRNCYAETLSGRNPSTLGIWGPQGTRVVAAESYWREPLKWNAKAAKEGRRLRVFCASLADVFEEWPGRMVDTNEQELCVCHGCGKFCLTFGDCGGPKGTMCDRAPRPMVMDDCRRRLFALIDATPHLDWMLLTKRPENIRRMWLNPVGNGEYAHCEPEFGRRNVWLGTTAGLQETADRNVPTLLECSGLSPLLWVSAEPLLGPIDFSPWIGQLKWIITGGESGSGARPFHPDWARSVRDQCQAAGVAFHHKQHGEWCAFKDIPHETLDKIDLGDVPVQTIGDHSLHRVGKKNAGRSLDGKVWDEFPANLAGTR